MRNTTPHQALALRWAELCNDPLLRDVPGKFELNAYGVIEMSPASNRHSRQQLVIGHALENQLPQGAAFVECDPADALSPPFPGVTVSVVT